MHIASFDARTDIVITGYNPENADITNPRGARYGFASYVRAISPRGDTRILYVGTSNTESEVLADAEELARRLTNRLSNYNKPPINFEAWSSGRPVYGSDAYIEYGQYDDLALERREDELEF